MMVSVRTIKNNSDYCVSCSLSCCCNSVCDLQPPESETQEESESEVNETPEPKQWISLGSEQEIDVESVWQTREKVLQSIILKKTNMKLIWSEHVS